MVKPNSVILYGYNKYLLEQSTRQMDQLQQSAAIFSCKIKRIAVHVETHYNIASKSFSHRRTREVIQLFTYLLTHKLFSSGGVESHV